MQELTLGPVKIKAWIDGVDFDDTARAQVGKMARLDIAHPHIAIMADVHAGKGAVIGSVIPTRTAIIPSAVGVDIGCGMVVQKTSLHEEQLPDNLGAIRAAIERAVPVGFAMHERVPASVASAWDPLSDRFQSIMAKHPAIDNHKAPQQLASLGGGNHFIEIVRFEDGTVGVMLHSGSRGIGNRIGTYFIEQAKNDMLRAGISNVDKDLAYLSEGTSHFNEYVEAVEWAQDYARANRDAMMRRVLGALRDLLPPFELTEKAVNCHHNYVAREMHFGEMLYVTRKGAVRAGLGDLGIIPGSMGAKSFVVRGKGNPESFESCSHGAGRRMGRNQAKRHLTVDDLVTQTAGVECRKDIGVLDEAPAAYKSIDAVMAAQTDLVEIVHTMKQLICVKG